MDKIHRTEDCPNPTLEEWKFIAVAGSLTFAGLLWLMFA